MNPFVIQIILFICILLFIIYLLKLINSLKRDIHISKFSLDSTLQKKSLVTSIDIKLWNLIDKLNNGLSNYNLINKLSSKYSKYILKSEYDYKKEINYFSIKLLIIIGLLILNIIAICFNLFPVNLITIILSILIGYFGPDLFWQYLFQKRVNKISKDLYLSIRTISSSLNNNSSIKEALKYASSIIKGDINDELEKIYDDLEYGISLANAYKKFYKRCKLKDIKYIYKALEYGEVLNLSYDVIFNNIYNYFKNKYELEEKFTKETDVYNYLFLIVLLIPLLLYIFIAFFKPMYFNKLYTGYGIFVLLGIILAYTIFIYIVKNLLEAKNE